MSEIMNENLQAKESLEAVDYQIYRDEVDFYSGLQRLGIYDDKKYTPLTSLEDGTVLWESGVPMAVKNSHLEVLLPQENADEFLVGVHPKALEIIQNSIIMPRQTYLNEEELHTVMSKPEQFDFSQTISRDLDNVNSLQNHRKLEVFRFGYPEYQVYSHYELDDKDALEEVINHGNQLLQSGVYRSDKEFIGRRINDIAKLHTEVFGNQAGGIGYYAGLDEKEIIRLCEDSGTQFMVALGPEERIDSVGVFTKGPGIIDWLNPLFYERSKDTYGSNTIFRIPYVVSSREYAETKSHFKNFMSIAISLAQQQHVAETGTNFDEAVISYNCSAISIFFTPKIINRAITNAGLREKHSLIELNYLAQTAD